MKQLDPPVTAIQDHVVAATHLDDLWAVYQLTGRSYLAESLATRQAIVGELREFAYGVQADFQLLRVARRWDAADYIERLSQNPPVNGHIGLWNAYLRSRREALEKAAVWAPAAFVAVRLAEPQGDLSSRLSEILEMEANLPAVRARLERSREERARRRDPERDAINLEPVESRLGLTDRAVAAFLPHSRPVEEEELQWLVRNVLGSGFGEPPIVPRKVLRLPWQQRTRSMEMWLSEPTIIPRHGHLELTNGFRTVCHAGLCLGELGESRPFTRECELMFSALETFPFPINASLNVRWIRPDMAKRKAHSRYSKNKAQLEEAEDSTMGAMTDDLQDAVDAYELHGRLSQEAQPVLFGTLGISIQAENRDELEQRIVALRRELPHAWYHPLPSDDQLAHAQSMYPGQGPRVSGYERLYTVDQVAAMVPQATHAVGAETHRDGKPTRAMHYAWTLDGHLPVFDDLYEAWELNRPPTKVLLGTLGSGKTTALLTLAYHAFIQGARVVDCDPKGDHRLHEHPEITEHAQEIVLGPSEEYRGALDPLRIAPPNERHTSAATFLDDVMGADNWEVRGAIHGAIGKVIDIDRERAACLSVIEVLGGEDGEMERKAAKALRGYAAGGIVQLGFAHRDDPLPQEAQTRYTYLNVRALDAPHVHTVRSEMSLGEMHGRAVMQLVSLFGMRLLGYDRARAKFLGFDESKFLQTLGARMLDQYTRWSRTYKAQVVQSTHMLREVSAQDNLIGYYYQFGMTSREQAREALIALELDPDGHLLAALTQRYGRHKHTKGQCLHRDLHGHSEEIQIDPGDLLPYIETSPLADVPEMEAVA